MARSFPNLSWGQQWHKPKRRLSLITLLCYCTLGRNWRTRISSTALWRPSFNMWRWGTQTHMQNTCNTYTCFFFSYEMVQCRRVTWMPGLLWSQWRKQRLLGTIKSFASPWVCILHTGQGNRGSKPYNMCASCSKFVFWIFGFSSCIADLLE